MTQILPHPLRTLSGLLLVVLVAGCASTGQSTAARMLVPAPASTVKASTSKASTVKASADGDATSAAR